MGSRMGAFHSPMALLLVSVLVISGVVETTSAFAFTSSPSLPWTSSPRFGGASDALRTTTTTSSVRRTYTAFTLGMNLLDDLGDMLSGGKLQPQSSLPYDAPFCTDTSCGDLIRTFAVRERPLSFTGEDFDVAELTTDGSGETSFATVRGAMLHLPGKDKMRIKSSGTNREVAVLDRVLVAATPSYDIYRGGMGAEKIGWIEKKLIAMSDTFDVYMEGKGGFGVTGLFKPKPAYRITGDFIDRNFVIRNEEDETVAKVTMDGWVQFDAWNHYQVQVAPGMDAVLAIACCVAIDEEFDEEHQERKKRKAAQQADEE